MMIWALAVSALLLSLERLTYYRVAHHPEQWRRFCTRAPLVRFGGPVDALHKLFLGFKVIQLGVFLGWCALFQGVFPPYPVAPPAALAVGGALVVVGMILNYSVFLRLGRVGVFYGAELGHSVEWVRGFPFSLFRHPQYLGTLVAIWGFFIGMRFPADDWIWLPLLQTLYYAWGAYNEP